MKAQFILILLLATAMLLGWSYLHYQYQLGRNLKLQQLTRQPVYVYLPDSTAVDTLRIGLKQIPQLESVKVETGLQAATELVNAYQLPISESMLSQYSFPHVVTLVFKPVPASIAARKELLKLLESRKIDPRDIDSQSLAWELAEKDLKLFRNRWSEFIIFSALLVLLGVVFLRLSLQLFDFLRIKGRNLSLLDKIRLRKARLNQSLLLLFVPMAVNAGAYYALVYFERLRPLIDWVFFCIQFATMLASTLVLLMLFKLLEQSLSWTSNQITVVSGTPDA